MSLQEWVAKTVLNDDGLKAANTATVIGEHGIHVTRARRPDAYAYCPDASDTARFSPSDFENALVEMPDLGFIVVVKRTIANETYGHADNEGIPLGGVGDLRSALRQFDNISNYRDTEDAFIRSRLDGNAKVASYRRRGATTYEIHRTGGLATVVVAMIRPYEVTADDAYKIINDHVGMTIDAVVTTNPNCRGMSSATLRAVANAGTTAYTFTDFVASLGHEWNH